MLGDRFSVYLLSFQEFDSVKSGSAGGIRGSVEDAHVVSEKARFDEEDEEHQITRGHVAR